MKKIISLLCIVLLTAGLVGCGISSSSAKAKLTAQSVVDKLKEKESAHMNNIEVTTADNDKNKLLGRPNQYTEKINWKDNRSKDSQMDCSVEVFKNKEDAIARKTYIESIIKATPMFTQYIEQKDNILLRVDGVLTPTQADEYIKIFKAL